MKTIVKYITSKALQPVVKKYLGKPRTYHYKQHPVIPPEVFHPGFFFSTKILLGYVLKLNLNNKKLLELGAGSGLISFAAAQKHALVTASDINPVAIEYLKVNSEKSQLPLEIILSDLFDEIAEQQFDIVVINPPYYKKNPQTNADFAWYCGENGEYFYKLFASLQKYMHTETFVLMILSEDCDINMIEKIAAKYYFTFEKILTKKSILGKEFHF